MRSKAIFSSLFSQLTNRRVIENPDASWLHVVANKLRKHSCKIGVY